MLLLQALRAGFRLIPGVESSRYVGTAGVLEGHCVYVFGHFSPLQWGRTLLNQHSILPLPAGPLALEQRPVPIEGGDLERDSSLRRVLCARTAGESGSVLRCLGWGYAKGRNPVTWAPWRSVVDFFKILG